MRQRRRFTWVVRVNGTGWGGIITLTGPATPAGAISKAMVSLTGSHRESVREVAIISKETA